MNDLYKEVEIKPQFKHDDDCCSFILQTKDYDVYYCREGFLNKEGGFILRYSDEGSDYLSYDLRDLLNFRKREDLSKERRILFRQIQNAYDRFVLNNEPKKLIVSVRDETKILIIKNLPDNEYELSVDGNFTLIIKNGKVSIIPCGCFNCNNANLTEFEVIEDINE
jgi:hypothetical protein